MLERLRLIDWSTYSHAYGPADDLPDLIEQLASADPKDWVAALDGLYWTIYHQGAVFDSTAVAVPFLLELLQERQVKCRGRIMELLAHIATGQSCLELHAGLCSELGDDFHLDDEAGADAIHLDIEELCDDEESRQQLEEERRWVESVREEVWAGWPVYLELGADLDKRVRICSPYLLGQLASLPLDEMPELAGAEDPVTAIPAAFARRLESEPNELVEASLVLGLEAWLPHAPQYEALIRGHAEDPNVASAPRLIAALCVCSMSTGVTSDAMDRLLDSLERIDNCSRWFESEEPSVEELYNPLMLDPDAVLANDIPENGCDIGADEDFTLPWLEEGLLQEILDRLSVMETPAPPRLRKLLLQRVACANQFTLENYAEALRRFVMDGRPLTCSMLIAELTDDQRELVSLLYNNATYWATNIGNVELAFDAMGVPYCRDTLAQWLGLDAEVSCPKRATKMLDQIVRAESDVWLDEALSVTDSLPADREACEICESIDSLILAHIGSDVFMPLLSRFPCLRTLEIGPYTTDRGLALLPNLPLTDLTLDERITDNGIRELSRFPALRSLNTFGAQLTDAGLETVSQLERLESLYLSGNLTLAGLHALLPLKSLSELSLPKMKLSLAVIPILQQLPALTTLSLHAQCLSADDRRRLKLELPTCQIWFSQCD